MVPSLVVVVTVLLAVAPAAGAAVQNVAGIGTFNAVACPQVSQCVAVGIIFASASSGATGAAVPMTTASAALPSGQAVQTIPGTEQLSAVSCLSDGRCLAVGENVDASNGVAVSLDPKTGAVAAGQRVQNIPGIVMAAVACPSTTRCLGVGHAPDGQGVAVSLDPATGEIAKGESVQAIPGTGGVGLDAVACSAPTRCLAVGENAHESAGVAVPLDPASGAISKGETVQSVTTKGVLVGLSCPSAAACLAVGWGADQPSVAMPLNPATGMVLSGQRVQTISSRTAKLSAVACPSVSRCLAVGNDSGDPSTGQVVPLSAVTGTISSGQTIKVLSGTGALNAVACTLPTRCVAAGSGVEASGGASIVLNPVTGDEAAPLPAKPPPTLKASPAPTTRPKTTATNLLWLFVLAGVLGVGGAAFVGVTSHRRRKRTATTH